jgi:hypothetical protein
MNFSGFLDSYSRGARTRLIARAAGILLGMSAPRWWRV